MEIVAYAPALTRQDAAHTTVRNLTDSAVATSQIEEEYPDPKAVEADIRRHIVGSPPRTVQEDPPEPGIAVLTTDTATNYREPLTAELLSRNAAQLDRNYYRFLVAYIRVSHQVQTQPTGRYRGWHSITVGQTGDPHTLVPIDTTVGGRRLLTGY